MRVLIGTILAVGGTIVLGVVYPTNALEEYGFISGLVVAGIALAIPPMVRRWS
jgi:hypothetical protein